MPAVDPERQFIDVGALAEIDSARKYLNAKAKFDAAEKAVTNLISYLDQVANALRKDRWRFSVSSVKASPTAETAGGSYNLNSHEWPSAQEISEILAQLHQARKAATATWENLSPADRNNLPPLPELR